jgi:hypothetical protein
VNAQVGSALCLPRRCQQINKRQKSSLEIFTITANTDTAFDHLNRVVASQSGFPPPVISCRVLLMPRNDAVHGGFAESEKRMLGRCCDSDFLAMNFAGDQVLEIEMGSSD